MCCSLGVTKGVVAFIAFKYHIPAMAALSRTSVPTPTPGDVQRRDRSQAERIADLFTATPVSRNVAFHIQGADGQPIPVPNVLAEVMHRAARILADGHSVAVLPDEQLLSSQEAADFLNISRQYLVRLVDSGVLAATRTGSHRRLRVADVAAYKADRDAKRSVELDRLIDLSEASGGYDLGRKPG